MKDVARVLMIRPRCHGHEKLGPRMKATVAGFREVSPVSSGAARLVPRGLRRLCPITESRRPLFSCRGFRPAVTTHYKRRCPKDRHTPFPALRVSSSKNRRVGGEPVPHRQTHQGPLNSHGSEEWSLATGIQICKEA